MIEAIQALFSPDPSTDPVGGMRALAVGAGDASQGVSFRDELSSQLRKERGGESETRDRVSAVDAGQEKRADTSADERNDRGVDASRGVEEAGAGAKAGESRDTEEEAGGEDDGAVADADVVSDEDSADSDVAAVQVQDDAAAASAVSAAASSEAGGEAAALAQGSSRSEGKRAAESASAAQASEGKARLQAAKDAPAAQPVTTPGSDTTATAAQASGNSAAASEQATTESADTKPLAVQSANAAAASPDQAAARATAPAPAAATTVASETGPALPTPIGATGDAAAQRADAAAAREADTSALNSARLTRGLASAVNQRGGAVTLRLTPPDMGTVRIQMQLTGAVLSASLHTETASAHQLLTQQLGQLRTSLESQGLTVERLHVQPMQPAQQSSASDQNNDGDAQQRQHNEGRSRGRQDGGSGNSGGDTRDRDARRDGRPAPQTFNDHLTQSPADAAA